MGEFLIIKSVYCGRTVFRTAKGETAVIKENALPENAVVIVLGAHVMAHRMSGTLYNRVKTAADYLLEHPQAKCITTGGQGWNEPRAEGDAAKDALIEMGVSEARIFAETKSTTTFENLLFAREILKKENLGSSVLLSTQSFHQWRSGKIAERLGLSPYPLIAADRPGTKLKHTVREGLAILKFLLFNRKQ